VSEIAGLLSRHGHTVRVLERHSDEATRGQAARALVAGGADPDEVDAAVSEFQPDVVHAHNLHPLFGWRALAAARARGVRTVLHLHNFRLFCAIAVAYRDGAPCHRCRGTNTWPGLRLRCRGSLSEAAVYALGLHRQQPRLFQHTDRFVVLSEGHGAQLKELGLPDERTVTLPNFIPQDDVAATSPARAGRYALVSGRLVPEKGFDTAIAAARNARVPLVVAGEGPDEPRLRRLAGDYDARFCGQLTPEELAEARRSAAVVLVPSRCEEACPYSVLDALAAGIPLLVSDRGGLPEMVDAEAVLPADDELAWTAALGAAWRDPGGRTEAGDQGLARAREKFGERRFYNRLLEVYGQG